jgi:hypothetical protein
MNDRILTPEQEAQAQRIAQIIGQKVQQESLEIARLLASQPDETFFGKTEFDVRDRVHDIGAHAFAAALDERKKGGTAGRA